MDITVEQLRAMGMDEQQIDAIMSSYGDGNVEPHRMSQNNVVQYSEHNTDAAKPVNCEEAMQVTTVTDLQRYASGIVVRFPDFAEGQPFVARVRRPSMLVLAKQNKIPNTLLSTAGKLFAEGGSGLDADDTKMLSEVYDICEVICEAALVQPTYKEIKDAGIELSDEQLMAIFNYTQTGIKSLEPFR